MNIPLRVKNLVTRHGTTDLVQIARDLNIGIQYAALSGKMRGCTCRILRRQWVIINETLDALSAEIVIAHELGHIRLHPGYILICAITAAVAVRKTKRTSSRFTSSPTA